MNFDTVSTLYSTSSNNQNGGYGFGSIPITTCNSSLTNNSMATTIMANNLNVYSTQNSSSNSFAPTSRRNLNTHKLSSKLTKQNAGDLTTTNNYASVASIGQGNGMLHRRNGSIRSSSYSTNNNWRNLDILPSRNSTFLSKKLNRSNF